MLSIHDRDASIAAPFCKSAAWPSAACRCRSCSPRRAAEAKRLVTDKSVIFLFLHGGPSQIETFDPKMTAPGGHPQRHRRGGDHACPASPSAASFPKLAAPGRQARRRPLLRPRRRQPRHQAGRRPRHLRRQPRLGLRPRRRHATIPSPACRPTSSSSRGPSIRRTQPGTIELRQVRRDRPVRQRLRPVRPRRRRHAAEEHEARRCRCDRLDDRRRLLAELDRVKRPLDGAAALDGIDRTREQAFARILGGVGRCLRPGEGRPATRRPLRHRPAGPAGEHRQEVEQLQQLRRQRQVARQAAAAGPPAVRARLRLRHGHDQLRLGHARRRQQRPRRGGHALHGRRRSTTPCRRSSKTSRRAA